MKKEDPDVLVFSSPLGFFCGVEMVDTNVCMCTEMQSR